MSGRWKTSDFEIVGGRRLAPECYIRGPGMRLVPSSLEEERPAVYSDWIDGQQHVLPIEPKYFETLTELLQKAYDAGKAARSEEFRRLLGFVV